MATARLAPVDAPQIAEHLFVDIETGNPEDRVMERLRAEVREEVAAKEPPKNYKKEEAIAEWRTNALVEKLTSIEEKAALLPEAPVRVVAILTSSSQMWQFHSMKREKPRWEASKTVSVEGFAGEKEMMEALCGLFADYVGPETLFVGHNILNFDFARLRLAIVRNGLPLPAALQLRVPTPGVDEEKLQPVFDTMHQFGRKFQGQIGPCFVSQDEMLAQMGIRPLSNKGLTGADVPRLLDEGKLDAVLLKNRADLLDLRKAFERMTGR